MPDKFSAWTMLANRPVLFAVAEEAEALVERLTRWCKRQAFSGVVAVTDGDQPPTAGAWRTCLGGTCYGLRLVARNEKKPSRQPEAAGYEIPKLRQPHRTRW